MKNKKIILFRTIIGLATVAAVAAPIATAVSCEIKDDYADEFTAKEVEMNSSLGILFGSKSDNVWAITMHKDTISKAHLIKLMSDKLFLAPSKKLSIGYEIGIVKDDKKVLTFKVIAPNSTTYSLLFLKDEIKKNLEEAIRNNSGSEIFFVD